MSGIETSIGYSFKNAELLETALTHSSYANERKREGAECNERLEFLGDAVLGFVTAEYLFKKYPELPEGKMTRLRADMVCEKSLFAVAEKLRFGGSLRLGRGEEHSGGRGRPSILADAVEAVIAAIFLDGGFTAAESFINKSIIEPYEAGGGLHGDDFKTALQELVQRKSGQVLEYVLAGETGPDHMKSFTVEVVLNGTAVAEGTGKSKQSAEQAAARAALEVLR